MFADAAVLVVRDMQVLERIAREQEAIYGPAASEVARVFAFDIPLEGEALVAAGDDVSPHCALPTRRATRSGATRAASRSTS